jgi:hypothetical protein
MAQRVYFIGQQYIDENLPMSLNVDPRSYFAFVQTAEEIFIQEALSSPFYEYLINLYSAATLGLSAMTAEETTLVGYIKPALAHRSFALYYSTSWAQNKQKGPEKQFDDYSSALALDEIKYKQVGYDNTAEWYMKRLQNFLVLSGAAYPQYLICNPHAVIPANTREGWNHGGLTFPKRNHKNTLFLR